MNVSRNVTQRQRGFSLVEVMVGIVISLIAILVIYQVFSVAEGIKRNATGAGDAQQNGLLSSFTMMLQFSNAGANIAVAGDSLDACPFVNDIKATLRPIPVLITDSGDDTLSDTFVVNYGASERLVTPVNFQSAPTIDSTADFVVQSPLGFQKNDVVVLASADSGGAGKCTSAVVTDVSAADADGYVTVKHGGPGDGTYDGNSALLNLGAAPRRIQFDVDANGTLRSQELFHVDVDNPSRPFDTLVTPVPVANNVVVMKVQYGLADPATGYLQKWVSATNDGTEDWTANAVLNSKTFVDLSRVKAIRIALVVRSESYDKCAYADVCPDPTTNAFSYTMFSQCDGIPCPAAITGSLDPTPGKGNFRYRVYETVVPMRNAIWNVHKAT
ncbi:MAG: PilW family protein [Betaproteobacteria bacterium]